MKSINVTLGKIAQAWIKDRGLEKAMVAARMGKDIQELEKLLDGQQDWTVADTVTVSLLVGLNARTMVDRAFYIERLFNTAQYMAEKAEEDK